MRVLVADDDRVVSHLLMSGLRKAGYEVIPAYDAMQALMFAVRVPQPDAILLDLSMPGGAGMETLRRIKASARSSHIPVVVVSGTTDPDAPEKAKELGAQAFLGKPVDMEALVAVLERLLGTTSPS